jgi:hypothetical protein
MQRGRNDRYVSGVWTDDLPQHLLWVGRGTTRPPEQRIFPSWSWVSTDGLCVMIVKRLLQDKITMLCESGIEDAATLTIYGKANTCLIKEGCDPSRRNHATPTILWV